MSRDHLNAKWNWNSFRRLHTLLFPHLFSFSLMVWEILILVVSYTKYGIFIHNINKHKSIQRNVDKHKHTKSVRALKAFQLFRISECSFLCTRLPRVQREFHSWGEKTTMSQHLMIESYILHTTSGIQINLDVLQWYYEWYRQVRYC